ncbi:hypothetical protein DAEQUDRAFT_254502 [Daedalea quercina L-15889]|uniref:F-box domain-containing protein n=1 Tax=Daedalea quercina L-15889 TaxID=1314783 RepID=A0A165QI26_9APHY|nr:hypothetical protein DAEQUDRAFT_254502 [Daedalea quercina L-15889]
MAEQAREFQSVIAMPESIRRWSSGDRRVPTAAKELQPLPQPLANRIPLEMHIEIISWLAWHKCSLLKCALVQRAWHPYCVHWLYRRICCRDGYRLIESAHQHESVKQYLTGTVKFDLDEEAAVTIALSMKMKTIMATELHPVGSQALGSLMPSLQILTLRKCDLRSRVDPVPWSSKTVTDLTLYATALRGDHRALSRIFDWFPQLRQLAFEGKLRVSHQFSSSSTLAAPSHRSHTPTVHQLRHLRLDVAGSGVTALLINLLIDLSLHTSLRTLETRIATQHMSAVERLLQKTGSSLTRLRALTTWTSDTILSPICNIARPCELWNYTSDTAASVPSERWLNCPASSQPSAAHR